MFGRAVIYVPLIALINGLLVGLLGVIQVSDGQGTSVFSPLQAFALNLAYAGIISMIAGFLLAPIFVAAGKHLPEPKLLYLVGCAFVVCLSFGALFARTEPAFVALMTTLGVIDAILWWQFVERHRHAEDGWA